MVVANSRVYFCILAVYITAMRLSVHCGQNMTKQPLEKHPPIELALDAVTVAVTDQQPRILTVRADKDGDTRPFLPHGNLDTAHQATLEKGIRDWVFENTGLSLGYVEQLYTFGDQYRDPRQREGGPRVISVAYLALVQEAPDQISTDTQWANWYEFLPWEDWRNGQPSVLVREIVPALRSWCGRHKERKIRAALAFGLDNTPWNPDATLERYELLYEAQLIHEAGATNSKLGKSMALDHRRMIATALGRLRGKIKYRPVVFELMPETFTLLQLQQTVEALAGNHLHKQNFRRLVANAGLVEETGGQLQQATGRPAALYRFRPEVLLERPAPGVAFSGSRWQQA